MGVKVLGVLTTKSQNVLFQDKYDSVMLWIVQVQAHFNPEIRTGATPRHSTHTPGTKRPLPLLVN